jgi:transcriptional regulator with XRE-family HTH domain
MSLEFDNEKFSKAIRIKRIIQMNVDLRTLASQLGMSAATLQRCEAGKKIPDLKTFANLCEWLGEPTVSFHKKVKSNSNATLKNPNE